VQRYAHFKKKKKKQKHQPPKKPRLLTKHNQRQGRQRGVVLQRATQRFRSFYADLIVYRHTRVGPNTNSAKQFQWATLSTGNRKNRNKINALDCMAILIVLSTSHFEQCNRVERYTHFNKRNQQHQSPTKPRLLTSKIQLQRSQRGVVLQHLTQHLRSSCVDFIVYRHTRVERSKYEFSKPVPMGDALGKVIAALDTWWY
jgi:hypothetical protein